MGYQIEIRHLRYFLEVARELHFRKAAEKLFISQPGLSRQIKQMEKELDLKLFERNNKNVVLTKAGQYLAREAEMTLKHLEDSFEHTKLIDRGMEGQVNLSYVGSAIQNVVPELLSRMREVHPNVHYRLTEMENADQIEALLKKDIDLGFVRLNEVPRALVMQPVFEDTFSLVLPKGHPLTKKELLKSDLYSLKQEDFILFDRSYSPDYYETVMQIFKDSGFVPNVSHNTVHASTIFRLVENNFGISVVPTSLALGYKLKVSFVEMKDIPQRTMLSAVWNPGNRNPVLGNILEMIRDPR